MKFLYNAPAILHKGALIVGDTHFGMEMKLRGKGIYDDQFSMRIYMKLKELVVKHKAKRVIFLGDVKENITMLDSQTRKVLSELSELVDITIVRGNHDGGIERFLGADVTDSAGIVHDNLGLAHGHSWPGEELFRCRYLVMGHQHPMVRTTDTLGKKHVEPAWVVAPPNVDNIAEYYDDFNKDIELILMPAFNPLVGSVLNSKQKKHLGPVLNNKLFKLDDALVFRLDGTGLGKLESQG
jgi:putative SbcD/Mre11-related phosphoesterase